jgi:hypothetical protein
VLLVSADTHRAREALGTTPTGLLGDDTERDEWIDRGGGVAETIPAETRDLALAVLTTISNGGTGSVALQARSPKRRRGRRRP